MFVFMMNFYGLLCSHINVLSLSVTHSQGPGTHAIGVGLC